MTGLELAKEIRKININALFVFLTGYNQYVMDGFKITTRLFSMYNRRNR